MPPFGGECSIMHEIRKTEEIITRLERRVEDLEYELATKSFSDEDYEHMEMEINDIRKLLDTNKEMLSKLHKHNIKSFSFAVIFVCGCFTIYLAYVLIAGLDY